MGKGRPAKPESLKKLHGNPGRRCPKTQTLPASPGKLGLPRGLSKTVQRHCAKLAKYLKDSGIPIDLIRPMFERYCRHLEVSSDAYRTYSSATLPDERKRAAKDWRDNSDAALRIEKQFETLLRKSKPPAKPELSELEKFQLAGRKLGVAN